MSFPRLCLAVASLSAAPLLAQTAQQQAILVSVQTQVAPPAITFAWPLDATATGYSVLRRVAGTVSWGTSTSIPGGGAATGWVDSNVSAGVAYEYWFTRNAPTGQGRTFVSSGLDLPIVDARGGLVLVVDTSVALPLATEIERLVADLRGDGWTVLRHNVLPSEPVPSVRARIQADWSAAPNDVQAVFLLGHVPVPYSGALNPDGHADHYGAWPADVYYGEMNGAWTDSTVNTTAASRVQNRNVPGDGKFDQTGLPSDVELMVGRVDLHDMPAFGSNEVELLRAYLDKDHAYRHREFAVDQRAVIDDNFGWFGGEAFAASGWRNFSVLVGSMNIAAGDYFTLQNTTTGGGYSWSYGCGGGSYQSASGIGTTNDFVTATNRNVFTMLFGSYFGDFDATNSFLRAPLCSGWTLTDCWAGRPHWSFHQMAMGAPIGSCARYSQNDVYAGGYGLRYVHLALMGDPTLRQHVIAPPSSVTAGATSGAIQLGWTASADPVAGYHVYRAAFPEGPFTRITATPATGTTFTDANPLAGSNAYLVKAVRLELSPSGTYWNSSQGVAVAACTPGAAVAQSLGTACGTPAPVFQSTRPVLGRVLSWSIGNAEPNGVGQMFAGTIASPLPIEGCDLRLSLSQLSVFLPLVMDGSGSWSAAFPLPNDPSWTCLALDLQAAIWGGSGLTMTNAMRLVLGT
ncbi:MAG: fibronectin type III domain-containing protein [Planctomycetota bacterium]